MHNCKNCAHLEALRDAATARLREVEADHRLELVNLRDDKSAPLSQPRKEPGSWVI